MTNILIIGFMTLTILFAIFYFILNKQLKKVSNDFAKLFIENAVMQEYIDIMKSKEFISDELVDKENFIKFLSDSRDWSFKYIEDVQFGIKEFINAVEPDFLYFDEYGEVGSAYPHYEAMVRINKAYKQLKTLMPKEEEIKE
jgi:hypothetical protein